SLGVGVGRLVNVISPLAADPTPFGMAPRMRAFKVVGLFEVGMYEYDSSLAYISIPAAQRFFRMGSAVTGIEVKLSDLFKAEGTARLIRDQLGFPYFTRTWMEMHRNLFLAIKKEKVLMFIILAMILLVAAFGIAGNLVMTVMQKQKEIGILKAMGATSSSIMKIFMAKGLIVGIAGTILGLCGGFSFVVNLDRISAFLERLLGFEMFPSDVYFLDKLPYQVNPTDVGATVIMAILVSVLATLYPSWRAARLDPIAAIRYE
ncbi:MAG: FtsX-like permease family protein, partial [Candidatus Methylomirabilales bacterium]